MAPELGIDEMMVVISAIPNSENGFNIFVTNGVAVRVIDALLPANLISRRRAPF